jgi:NAD(P)-dependent dehydrogenase (short-subunit alcohol dehydrogenase family)
MSEDTDAGRVVVVTGAARGIGAATANAFDAVGYRVVVADVDEAGARRTVAGLRGGLAVVTDITDPSSVARLCDVTRDAYGRIDVLVNNAMVCHEGALTELSPDEIDADIRVNLIGPMLVTRGVLPAMVEQGTGVILNLSSVNGLTALGDDAYSAAKAGLLQLTRSVAAHFGPRGIRCNAVAPATIATEYWAERGEDALGMSSLQAYYPLGRIGTTTDVTNALVFLASDRASWITGAVLPVDGGLLAGNRQMTRELLRGASQRSEG